ncbi:MAG TPA: hypothetical protein DEQ61_23640 [Streptomyces sp.]|nr:hypothetical protein [Streptomyces sp.]
MIEQKNVATAEDTTVLGRPAGATHGDAAYWARIHRIAAQAPPLSDRQRAVIRAAFLAPSEQETAA